MEAAISLVFRAVIKAQEEIADYDCVLQIVDLFRERNNQFLYRPPENLYTNMGSLFGYSTSMIQRSAAFHSTPNRGPGHFPLILAADRPVKFLETVWDMRYRRCYDNRDRIYAAPSFMTWELRINVTVEYERTVFDVYTAFMRKLLRFRVIKALLFAGIWDRREMPTINSPDSDKAPSWVCEYRSENLVKGKYKPWYNPIYENEENEDIDELESPVFEFGDSPYARRLKIGLTILDEVKVVVASIDEKAMDYRTICQGIYYRYEVFARARELSMEEFPNISELRRFAEILGLDYKRLPVLIVKLSQYLLDGRSAKVAQTVLSSAEPDSRVTLWSTPKDLVTARGGDAHSEEAKHDMLMLNRRLTFTGLFSTNRGWIGTGPDTILVGDLVVRIQGLLRTCILRKVESSNDYMLVSGASYETTWE